MANLTRQIGISFLAVGLTQIASAALIENPLVAPVCGNTDLALATTCSFTGSGGVVNMGAAGTPTSARTDFIESWDTQQVDGLTLAEHELFHAIGFAVAYNNFFNKVFATPGRGANGIPADSRVYSTNGTVGGILVVLGGANNQTHTDPAATGAAPYPATGYNQANDIMQATLAAGVARALNATDASVLNDAFGYVASGLTINVVNVGGSLDDADLAIINNAVTAVNQFYVPNRNSPVFTWSVAEAIPEPSTWVMLLSSGAGLLIWKRRGFKTGPRV